MPLVCIPTGLYSCRSHTTAQIKFIIRAHVFPAQSVCSGTSNEFEDVNKLLKILHTLVDEGNTVIVIEHNLDVIKTSDHIIDLGPLGGEKGGKIIFEGTPENIVKEKKSFTGKYLKSYLI